MSRILPILFNTEMTKAILDGRKAVTRRVVKLPRYITEDEGGTFTIQEDDFGYSSGWSMGELIANQYIKPAYKAGDILYVRESYHPNYFDIDTGWGNNHAYKVDYEAVRGEIPEPKWTPSIHMPKEAARIWLKVTDVRAERLQDITEEQAKAEGCIDYHDKTGNGKFDDVLEFDLTARDAFVDLWNSTLKKDSTDTWAHNPWVWVYEFERCEKPS